MRSEDRNVWVTQAGASPASSLKISVPADGHVSDALREAAKLFFFNGASVPPGELLVLHQGVPLDNRTRLSALGPAGQPLDLVVEKPSVKMDFAAFYQAFYPQLVPALPAVLRRYSGRPETLWATLLDRQGLTQDDWEDVLTRSLAKMHAHHRGVGNGRVSSISPSLFGSLSHPPDAITPLSNSIHSPVPPPQYGFCKLDHTVSSQHGLNGTVNDSLILSLTESVRQELPPPLPAPAHHLDQLSHSDVTDGHLAVPAPTFPSLPSTGSQVHIKRVDSEYPTPRTLDPQVTEDATGESTSSDDAFMSTVDMKKRLHSLTSSSVKGNDSIKHLLAAVGVTRMTEDKMTRLSPRGLSESFFRQQSRERKARSKRDSDRRRSVPAANPVAPLSPQQEIEQRKRLRRISDCDISSTQAMRTLLSNSCTTITDMSGASASPRGSGSLTTNENRCSPVESSPAGGSDRCTGGGCYSTRPQSAAGTGDNSPAAPFSTPLCATDSLPNENMPVIVPVPPSPPLETARPTPPGLPSAMSTSLSSMQDDSKLLPGAMLRTHSATDSETPLVSPESDVRLAGPTGPAGVIPITRLGPESQSGSETYNDEATTPQKLQRLMSDDDVARLPTLPVQVSPSQKEIKPRHVPPPVGEQPAQKPARGGTTPFVLENVEETVSVAATATPTTARQNEPEASSPCSPLALMSSGKASIGTLATSAGSLTAKVSEGEPGHESDDEKLAASPKLGLSSGTQAALSNTQDTEESEPSEQRVPRQGSLRRECRSRLVNAKVTIDAPDATSDQGSVRSSRRGSMSGLPPTMKRGKQPANIDSIRDALSGIQQLPGLKNSPVLSTPSDGKQETPILVMTPVGDTFPATAPVSRFARPAEGAHSTTSTPPPTSLLSPKGEGDARPPPSPKRPLPLTPKSTRSLRSGNGSVQENKKEDDADAEAPKPLNLPQHVMDAINASSGTGTQRMSIKRSAAASLKQNGSLQVHASPLASTAKNMRELLCSAVSTPTHSSGTPHRTLGVF